MKKTEIDISKVAELLGAKVVRIPSLTKDESSNFSPFGSPVMIAAHDSAADELLIYYFGSRMMRQYGRNIDDVVGYRIVDNDEEKEFRGQCGTAGVVVRYYVTKEN